MFLAKPRHRSILLCLLNEEGMVIFTHLMGVARPNSRLHSMCYEVLEMAVPGGQCCLVDRALDQESGELASIFGFAYCGNMGKSLPLLAT